MKKNQAQKFIVLFLFFLFAYSWRVEAQTGKEKQITMEFKNEGLPSIFKRFEKVSGYKVLFIYDEISSYTSTGKVEKATVDEALKVIIGKNPLKYHIDGQFINITKEDSKKFFSQVKGKVFSEEDGLPVIGATIIVEDANNIRAITDNNGNFQLSNVSKDSRVRISYVGLETQFLNPSSYMSVVMKSDTKALDEVVVTGMFNRKKEGFTGSAVTIKGEELKKYSTNNVAKAIAAVAPGLRIMDNINMGSNPNNLPDMRMRGGANMDLNAQATVDLNSASNDVLAVQGEYETYANQPLLIMDGFEISIQTLADMDPDRVASIVVLKDAAATAIYGSRAANGVIVVKTKRGIVGQSYINVQASYSFDEAPKSKLEMMNTQEKVAFETGLYNDFPHVSIDGRIFSLLRDADMGKIAPADAQAELERLSKINTNWYDEIFKLAHTQNYIVSLSGGSEKTQYYFSMNYMNQGGVMPNNEYSKFGASLKLTHDFNKHLRIYGDIYANIRDDRTTASIVDPLEYATFANPYERPYDENGNYEYDRSYYADLSKVKEGYMYDFNVLKDLNENTSKTHYISNQVNLKLEYRILEELMFSTSGTFSNTSSHSRSALNPGSFSSKYNSWIKSIYPEREITDNLNNGSLDENTSRNMSYTWRNQLEYARNFKEEHFVTAVVGQEMSDSKSRSFGYYSPEYDPMYGLIGFPDLSGILASKLSMTNLMSTSEEQDRSVSFFLTGSYSYKDRYVLSGSYRWDGVDIIGKDNRFTPLWNVSFKYNLHNEEFMKRFAWIDVLSIRGSYGFTGSIDHNAYPFTILKYGSSSYRYNGDKIPSRITPGNPSIKWQRKEDRSIGLDFSLLRNRINGTVNYYNNETRDLLDRKKIAVSSGRKEVKANVASLNNKGWEVSLSTVNINYKTFRWSTSFNIAVNKNRVTDTYYQAVDELSSISRNNSSQAYFVKGQPTEAWYGYKFAGVDPATGHTLAYIDAKDNQGNPMGHLTADGRYVIDMDSEFSTKAVSFLGEAYPPISGGFGTQFNLGRFSLSAQFSFMAGHKIKSFESSHGVQLSAAKYNQLAQELYRWRKVGDITNIPAYTVNSNASSNYFFSSQVESGNYLKCNNISLGYNMDPEICKKLCLTRMRINFNIQNVFTSTKYRGLDPENMGAFGYPSARSYVLSLNIGI